MAASIPLLDYGDLEGGLARMMDRYKEQGTLTGDFEADDYLRRSANAAFLGLLYDQRVRAEYAFTGPMRLEAKLGHLDMQRIADMDPDQFRTLFGETPSVHRFTNKMAETTQAVARKLAEEYGGDAARIWNDGASFDEIKKRVRKFPGFGAEKAEKMKYVLHYFGYRNFAD